VPLLSDGGGVAEFETHAIDDGPRGTLAALRPNPGHLELRRSLEDFVRLDGMLDRRLRGRFKRLVASTAPPPVMPRPAPRTRAERWGLRRPVMNRRPTRPASPRHATIAALVT